MDYISITPQKMRPKSFSSLHHSSFHENDLYCIANAPSFHPDNMFSNIYYNKWLCRKSELWNQCCKISWSLLWGIDKNNHFWSVQRQKDFFQKLDFQYKARLEKFSKKTTWMFSKRTGHHCYPDIFPTNKSGKIFVCFAYFQIIW